jgi:hypothetical protein
MSAGIDVLRLVVRTIPFVHALPCGKRVRWSSFARRPTDLARVQVCQATTENVNIILKGRRFEPPHTPSAFQWRHNIKPTAGLNRRFGFKERSQFFIRTHNESQHSRPKPSLSLRTSVGPSGPLSLGHIPTDSIMDNNPVTPQLLGRLLGGP